MSPKNKGKFGKAQSAVEVQDEFVSTVGSVSERLQPHAVKIAVAAGVMFFIVGVVSAYRWWDARQERAATLLLEKALVIAQTTVLPPAPEPEPEEGAKAPEAGAAGAEGAAAPAGEAKPEGAEAKPEGAAEAKPEGAEKSAEPPPPAADEDGDGVPDSFPSEQARATAALVVLDELDKEYGSTDVAGEARVLRADVLQELGRADEANAIYKSYAASGASEALRRVARERAGFILEAQAMKTEDAQARQAKLAEALEVFRAIQPADDGPGRDRALYHEARILASQGKLDEATAAWKKALELAPEGVLAYDIKQRLALAQAKK